MSILAREASGHLSAEDVQELAGTSRMAGEPLPKLKPSIPAGQLAPVLWDFAAELANALGHGSVPNWPGLAETSQMLWRSAVEGIAAKFWEGEPISLWVEAERAFETQNQIGGLFAISWKDAPVPLRWAYWGSVLLLTRLADYEAGDTADTLAETAACRLWVIEKFTREVVP